MACCEKVAACIVETSKRSLFLTQEVYNLVTTRVGQYITRFVTFHCKELSELYQQKSTKNKMGSISVAERINETFCVHGFVGGTLVSIEPSSKPALISSIVVLTSAGTSCSRS